MWSMCSQLSGISHNCGVSPCTLTGKFAAWSCRPKANEFQTSAPQLNAFTGCEVAVSDAPSGQLIVVVEAEDSETLIQTIESVRNVEGVLAVSLVYHQQEEQGEETP
ncbi:chaperone NapD [Escherichia coli]|nr:chaperone NapD [Escherichia coli]